MRASEWTDIAGLLAPLETFRDVEHQVASGSVNTYDDLQTLLRGIWRDYPLFEWQYVAETIERETKTPLAQLTKETALRLVDEWQRAALAIHSLLLEDSKKEFGPGARIGYGLDLSERETEADFTAVRGTMQTNSAVQRIADEEREIVQRAADLKSTITSAK
jgi:hypothetical protein